MNNYFSHRGFPGAVAWPWVGKVIKQPVNSSVKDVEKLTRAWKISLAAFRSAQPGSGQLGS